MIEEKDEEMVKEEGAADVDGVEDGEELRQKIDDLEKVIAEKNIENGKLIEVLRQARTHLRLVKEDSEKLNELENVKEENEELVLRLKQSSEKLDDLEVLKEENKELDLRLKQDHEKIENLEAQVTSLHSLKQMESNQNEKLKKKNDRLQEDIEIAHETIRKGLARIKIQDAKILELEGRLKQNFEQVEDLEAIKEENKALESRLKRKEEEVENLYLNLNLYALNEENEELKSRLEQKNKEIESLEAVKEENKELELRLKQNHEKVLGNLEAQVAFLSSQSQLESSVNEKLKTKNNRLQEDIATAHETIRKGLAKIQIQDTKIQELECSLNKNYEQVENFEALKEENKELELRLKQKNGELESLGALNEENKELKSRLEEKGKEVENLEAFKDEKQELELILKQKNEKVENLDAQVASLSTQNQMESSQNEKLMTKNNRLQEDIATAHETIRKGLAKIKIQDTKILELEYRIKNTFSPAADLEAKQSKIENLEKTLKEKELVLNQVKSSMLAEYDCAYTYD